MSISRPIPIPSTPLIRRAAAFQAALRRPDYRGLYLPAALVVLWSLATYFGWVDTRILVSPLETLKTAWHLLISKMLWVSLGYSLARDASGFLAGSIIGLLLGTLLGTSRLADRLISPTFHAFKQIAVFAWIPLIAVWFGLGEPAKIAFIALVVFPPVLLNTFDGIRSVSRDYIEVARAFEFSTLQQSLRVILPAALPQIFTGLRLGLIYAWLATIGAEYFLKAAPGVGNILIDGREKFLMDQVITGVAVVAAVGYVFHYLTARLEKRLLSWRTRTDVP
jgi:sulfonate transport system permease protein